MRNTITKCQSDSREGGEEIVSIPWLPPLLARRGGVWVGGEVGEAESVLEIS